ncbi:MAG: DNA-protecting protein DprA [Deltaproteobacteria bacterium]|nr:DNA-protecting protein DprA [Deltaproteobacteria bacterium]
MHSELRDWIALRLTPGIGNVACKNLLETFGSPMRIMAATREELAAVAGMSPRLADALKSSLANHEVDRALDRLTGTDIHICTYNAPDYPGSLKNIYDPPPHLYVRGRLQHSDCSAVAVVGSRNASDYGLRAAADISRELAVAGLTIVSGMAAGIDSAAHRGALSAGGRTIAVLGCGADVCYPAENRRLYEAIAQKGAIVSEYAPGTGPDAYHFPARNRIISGMARAIVVVEASPKSGSLITARLALEQGRDVFAVPGSIYSFKARGAHQLIRSGAALVESGQDIIEALGMAHAARAAEPESPAPEALAPEARRVYDLLEPGPAHIDRLICETSLPSSAISAALLELELGGFIRQLPGKHFERSA